MILVDTHTHLYLEPFQHDIDLVIQRSIENDTPYLCIPNIHSSTISNVLDLCSQYPRNCFPMLGLHPTEVNEHFEKELALIKNSLNTTPVIAVGEIGLDLYHDKTFFEQQQQAFITQLQWASSFNLPVSLHVREAIPEMMKILDKHNHSGIKGVFHCFSGNKLQAEEAIDFGFYIGVGGTLTYKNSDLCNVVKYIDLKNIVLETDAPFLAPAPHRGKRNESGYVKLIAAKIAEIKEISIEEVAAQTTQNAFALFGNLSEPLK